MGVLAGEVGLARNGVAIVPTGNCDTGLGAGTVESMVDVAGVVHAVDARISRPSIQVREDGLIRMFSFSWAKLSRKE